MLYNSLKQMLEYHDNDLDDVFMQTFRISYQDVFGSTIDYDLKEKGDSISVTQENKYVSNNSILYFLNRFIWFNFRTNLIHRHP